MDLYENAHGQNLVQDAYLTKNCYLCPMKKSVFMEIKADPIQTWLLLIP